jgi:energy-converting hydrogenase Eha subunit C
MLAKYRQNSRFVFRNCYICVNQNSNIMFVNLLYSDPAVLDLMYAQAAWDSVSQIVTIIVWVAASIVIGVAGQERECGSTSVALLSLFLSPICGVIALFASERTDEIKHLRRQKLYAEISTATQTIATFRESAPSDPITEEQRQQIVSEAWLKLQQARKDLAKLG